MRSEAREAAYKIIFAHLLGGDCTKGARGALYRAAKLKQEEATYAEKLVNCVLENEETLMAKISAHVVRYADYRIYPADRAALLVALAEIEYFEDIPPVVSVSEAAGLASKYSTENSADFVNGVLGGIINQ